MSNEHDDYLTKGEVFLASIGREQEESEDEEEQEGRRQEAQGEEEP
mgnify:CR=1 FL=1